MFPRNRRGKDVFRGEGKPEPGQGQVSSVTMDMDDLSFGKHLQLGRLIPPRAACSLFAPIPRTPAIQPRGTSRSARRRRDPAPRPSPSPSCGSASSAQGRGPRVPFGGSPYALKSWGMKWDSPGKVKWGRERSTSRSKVARLPRLPTMQTGAFDVARTCVPAPRLTGVFRSLARCSLAPWRYTWLREFLAQQACGLRERAKLGDRGVRGAHRVVGERRKAAVGSKKHALGPEDPNGLTGAQIRGGRSKRPAASTTHHNHIASRLRSRRLHTPAHLGG